MIKLAFRNILRNKVYTSINVVGLTIAFVVSIVIFSYVGYHFSFDKNVKDRERVFRLITRIDNGTFWASTFTAFDEGLKNKADVDKHLTVFTSDESFDFGKDENTIRITAPIYADGDIFEFFNYHIASGKASALNEPNTIFLTYKTAQKLFGNKNPIGEVLVVNNHIHEQADKRVYTVVGVLDKKQELSHLQFDLIFSKAGFYQKTTIDQIKSRKVFAANVYVKLLPNVDIASFEGKLHSFIEFINKEHGPPIDAFETILQPLNEIHFTPGLNREFQQAIRKSQLYILIVVGILLFSTAIFNFLIMNVARSEKRMHQNRVMQFLGGNKRNIVGNSIWETLFSIGLSIGLSIFLLHLVNPYVASEFFHGWQVRFQGADFWIINLVLLSVTLCAGIVASNAHLIFARKSNLATIKNTQNRAIPFIVFQFTVLVGLVCFSLILNKQLNYIQNKNLGFYAENVMVIQMPERDKKNIVFGERMEKVPGVLAAGTAWHYPGYRLQDMNLETLDHNFTYKMCMMDSNALNVLGIKIIDQLRIAKETPIIVNKTFFNALNKYYTREQIASGEIPSKEGEEEPGMLRFSASGITNDFHYNSLYSPIGNLAFFMRNPVTQPGRFVLLRFNQANVNEVLTQVHAIGNEIYPGRPLSPEFLNEQINAQYQSEATLFSVTRLFSVLTILIACLGLFAFTLFSTQKRIKEIGVRKVNGATVLDVLSMLNFNFIKWVMVAFIIAVPISYLAMHKWLENFAYKTELSWWIFALAGLMAIAVAIIAVSWQSWRAATRNPVEALRYE